MSTRLRTRSYHEKHPSVMPLGYRDVSSWHGLYTSGSQKGEWVSFHKYTTMSKIITEVNGVEYIFGYDNKDGQMYFVTYIRAPITPVNGNDYYWLVEVKREKYDGIL